MSIYWPASNLDEGKYRRVVQSITVVREPKTWHNGSISSINWFLNLELDARPRNMRLKLTRDQVIMLRNSLNNAIEQRLAEVDQDT
jgi:hypothetical protein